MKFKKFYPITLSKQQYENKIICIKKKKSLESIPPGLCSIIYPIKWRNNSSAFFCF